MTYGIHRPRRNWRAGKMRRRFGDAGRDYRLLEKMFYYYPAIKREVTEIIQERGYYQNGHKEGGGSSNHAFISDPTAQIAIKHIQLSEIKRIIINTDTPNEYKIDNPQKWMFVVEQTLRFFEKDELVKEVIYRRYFRNESYVYTCAELDIENKDEYYRAKDTGLQYARDVAIQIGLIKVF